MIKGKYKTLPRITAHASRLTIFFLSTTFSAFSQSLFPLQTNSQFLDWYKTHLTDSVSKIISKPDFTFSDSKQLFDQLDTTSNELKSEKGFQDFSGLFHPNETNHVFGLGSITKILYGIPTDHYSIVSHQSESFSLNIYPVFGYEVSSLKKSDKTIFGFQKHNYQGFSATGNIGGDKSFFVLVRDNQGKLNYDPPTNRTTIPGVGYIKADKPYSVDFSEISAELTFPFGGGNLSIGKSNPNWSINGESTVLSKNVVSFPNVRWMIHLDDQVYYEMIWAEFVNYVPHDNDGLLDKKSMAAHRIVYRPTEKLRFSFFESVLYSGRKFEPVYHIPFMFLKAAEHYNNSPDNANIGVSAEWFPSNQISIGYQFLIDDISTNIAFSDSTNNKLASLLGISYNGKISGKAFSVKLTAAYATRPTYYHHELATQYFHYGDALGLNVYRDRLNLKFETEFNIYGWITVGGSLGNWKLPPAYYSDGKDYFQNPTSELNKSFSVKVNPVLPLVLEYKILSVGKSNVQYFTLRYGIF